MAAQWIVEDRWKKRYPIATALASSNDDLVSLEVDVLHSQPGTFEEAQPSTVEQTGHQLDGAGQTVEDGAHFFPRENHRQVLRMLGAHEIVEPGQLLVEHAAIEKEQRRQRLVLRRGSRLRSWGTEQHGTRA
jgi:hypothetical protein